MNTARSNQHDAVFAAVSNGARRRILDQLQSGPKTITGLSEGFSFSRQAVRKHIALLERGGLVRVTPDRRESLVTLEPLPLREVERWVSRYREHWAGRLDRLKQVAEGLEGANEKPERT